jgi:lipopolysaccharide/colanic/teichoic acid biosynthesis glycosyltransferase
MTRTRPYDAVKRAGDVLAASIGLILSAPVQAVVALLVRANLGSPVLFRQKRPGRGGRVFIILKFRTMKDPDPANGFVSDADRLTRFGRILRSTSLDELPALWNVLRGEMSFVGPRPLLVEYVSLYTPEQARRHEVRPGVTGLAQVSGRNAVTWEKRFELDVEYVDHRSLLLDLSILARTFTTVLSRKGIASEGEATMRKFRPRADHPHPDDSEIGPQGLR